MVTTNNIGLFAYQQFANYNAPNVPTFLNAFNASAIAALRSEVGNVKIVRTQLHTINYPDAAGYYYVLEFTYIK